MNEPGPLIYGNTYILFFQTYAFVTLADAEVANRLLGNVSNTLLKSSIHLYFIQYFSYLLNF